MTTNLNRTKSNGAIATLLGPVLVLCIALATANLLTTYKRIHHHKQESIWSIIQLDKEMDNTLFDAQQYINGYLNEKPLRMSYEVLWSRFPVTISSMGRDEIVGQIGGLTPMIYDVFNHVKSAESMILEHDVINKVELNQWVNHLNKMARDLNQQLLQNIASSNSEYSYRTASKIIKTAAILLILIITFILYLGYLLITLREERSRNLHMLAHDTLTGLHSRDFVMRTIQTYCEDKATFALLAFDLNKFKAVNDTFGHHAGDQLLIHLADKFQKTLSKFGVVGRIGGDEFLWLTKSNDPRIIQQQHNLFLDELKTPCIVNDKPLYLHISSGGGFAADYHFHPTQLLEHVDEAMYQAKSQQIKHIFWANPPQPDALSEHLKTQPSKEVKRTSRSELLEMS